MIDETSTLSLSLSPSASSSSFLELLSEDSVSRGLSSFILELSDQVIDV